MSLWLACLRCIPCTQTVWPVCNILSPAQPSAEAALASDLAQLWQEQRCGPQSFGAFGQQGHFGQSWFNHSAARCALCSAAIIDALVLQMFDRSAWLHWQQDL